MEGGSSLARFLSNDELTTLTEAVKNKLTDEFVSLANRFAELESDYEKAKIVSEQQYFELEKRLIESNTRLTSESQSREDTQHKYERLDADHKVLLEEVEELRKTKSLYGNEQENISRENRQLQSEKKEIYELLEKKDREIDRLNVEWNSISAKLTETNNAKLEAMVQLSEIQSKNATLEYREKSIEQEKIRLEQQIQWLNDELHQKTLQIMNSRKEQSGKLLELQSESSEKSDRISQLESTVENLQTTTTQQATKIDSLIEKIKECRDSNLHVEEQYKAELDAQTKLVSLYKDSAEDAEKKMSEMKMAVKELQSLLTQATEANNELENYKEKLEDENQQSLAEKDTSIQKLEVELKNANDLLKGKPGVLSAEELETRFPIAATTSKHLKAGMTLTQIYTQYIETTNFLDKEREENQQLNKYLREIMQEIEEKAPMLREQRQDYEKCLENNQNLSNLVDSTVLKYEKLQLEADGCRRKFGHVTRENARFKQRGVDLSQQVCVLLKELEEARGTVVSSSQDDLLTSPISSSSQVITQKLVTFRSIEELQSQNEKLLEITRELSDKREEEETQSVNQTIKDLKDQLDIAVKELNELREARTKQAEMVESIVRQRDMYKVLLTQSGMPVPVTPMPRTRTSRTMGKVTTSSPQDMPDSRQEASSEIKEALKALQQREADYKKTKDENEKILNDQIDQLKQTVSNMRLQNAKLSSQLDYSAERFKTLQSNVEGYKVEITALQEKNQKLSNLVARHEQTALTLREDLKLSQESLSHSEARLQYLQNERDLLKVSEGRLVHEKESLMREQNSQKILTANLQAIQNNLERQEFEVKTRMTNQVQSMEQDVTSLKRKVESKEDELKLKEITWQGQAKQLQERVEKEMAREQKNRDELVGAYANVHSLKQQLSETESKLLSAEIRLSKLGQDRTDSTQPQQVAETSSSTAESADETKRLNTLLSDKSDKITSLNNQIEKLKQQEENYRSVAESMEQSLKDQNETSRQFQTSMEARLQEYQHEKEELMQRVSFLEDEKNGLMTDSMERSEGSENLASDLRKQLTHLQMELQEALTKQEVAIANEKTAREDCQNQMKLHSQATMNYIRELVLHAADVESLTNLKQQLQGFNQRLSTAQELAANAETQLVTAQDSWAEQEALFKQQTDTCQSRCHELENQNKTLHEQMEMMSSQIVAIQRYQEGTGDHSFSEDSSKSTEQMLEVIKFLRKEREIAETKFEVIKAESARLKQQVLQLGRQLEESTAALAEERAKNQATVFSAAQHADILKNVENLNILQDSNRILREDKNRMTQHIKELESKVKTLERSFEPVQHSNNDLTAQIEVHKVEKVGLEMEIGRWKARVNQVIEQSHKRDPDEKKNLIAEREELKKQLSASATEVAKLNFHINALQSDMKSLTTESTKCESELTQIRKDLNQQKQKETYLQKENSALKSEIQKVKTDVQKVKTDVVEKNKTINQLKKIGRKYKQQYDELCKEQEQQKQSGQVKDKAAAEAEAKLKEELVDKVKVAEENLEEANKKVAKLEPLENEKNKLNETIKELNTQMETLKNEKTQLNEEHTAEVTNLKNEHSTLEQKSRTIMQTARSKLQTLKDEAGKLRGENQELRNKLDETSQTTEQSDPNVDTIRTNYETQIEQLEQQISSLHQQVQARSNDSDMVDKLKKENIDLLLMIQQQQKLLELSGPSQSSTSTTEPPTANIKPTPATQKQTRKVTQRQAPVQPVSTGPSVKATASIRPMAIATPPVTTATPTATVMPTTVSPPTSNEGLNTEVTSSQSRPTQPVQPVSPLGSMPALTESEIEVTESVPSTSGIQERTTKRQREDESSTEEPAGESPTIKRTKTQAEVEELVQSTSAVIEPQTQTQEPESSATEACSEGNTTTQEAQEFSKPLEEEFSVEPETTEEIASQQDVFAETQDDEGYAVTSSVPEAELREAIIPEEDTRMSDDTDDVIIVEDDIGQGEHQMQGDEYVIQGEEFAYDVEEDENEIEDDEQDEMDDDADDEDSQETGVDEAHSSDDDVVIVESDEETGTSGNGQPKGGQSECQRSAMLQPPPQTFRLVQRTERLPSLGRPTVTPFGAFNPGGGFEDDDGMVPSTPTLCVPKRSDGFAEAVSSPMVPQGGRFVFGSVPEGSSQSEANFASQGLATGMDDTKMDIFDESGTGRSVPTTPLTTVAPVTIITQTVAITTSVSAPETYPIVESSSVDTPSVVTISEVEPVQLETVMTVEVEEIKDIATDNTDAQVAIQDIATPVIEELGTVVEGEDEEILEGSAGEEDTSDVEPYVEPATGEEEKEPIKEDMSEVTETGTEESSASDNQPAEEDTIQDGDETSRLQQEGARQRRIQRIVWESPPPMRAAATGPPAVPPIIGQPSPLSQSVPAQQRQLGSTQNRPRGQGQQRYMRGHMAQRSRPMRGRGLLRRPQQF